jgi:hypothetical protein
MGDYARHVFAYPSAIICDIPSGATDHSTDGARRLDGHLNVVVESSEISLPRLIDDEWTHGFLVDDLLIVGEGSIRVGIEPRAMQSVKTLPEHFKA